MHASRAHHFLELLLHVRDELVHSRLLIRQLMDVLLNADMYASTSVEKIAT